MKKIIGVMVKRKVNRMLINLNSELTKFGIQFLNPG
jgi:hypothetical protein